MMGQESGGQKKLFYYSISTITFLPITCCVGLIVA
jgi:hypothetical protein